MDALTKEAEAALSRCKSVSPACIEATESAAGVLVFPEVTSASIIVGGAGAKGVLWVDGKIDGYYGLGEGSVGLQIGVKKASEVFALNADALNRLRGEGTWKIGTDADITVIGAGATEKTASGQGGTAVFVFDEKGLSAGVAIEGVTIQKLAMDDAKDPKDTY
jgi:lipid-binding SYLF domain-containing protein